MSFCLRPCLEHARDSWNSPFPVPWHFHTSDNPSQLYILHVAQTLYTQIAIKNLNHVCSLDRYIYFLSIDNEGIINFYIRNINRRIAYKQSTCCAKPLDFEHRKPGLHGLHDFLLKLWRQITSI